MNKQALVTGASEGIGRSFAVQLAQAGYAVTGVARNEARLQDLMAQLGPGHSYLVADLTAPGDLARVQKAIHDKPYHLLINNAGFGIYGSFTETDLSRLQSMTQLNIDALMALSHTYLKGARPGDALINISSMLAFLPFPAAGAYAATKAFVTAFSEALWYEQKKRGVYVMGFCPGITVSSFHERAGGKEETFRKSMAQTSDEAVKNALKALSRRSKPTVVSGLRNILMTAIPRFIGRKQTVSMMGSAAP